jgi:hypothetical protein
MADTPLTSVSDNSAPVDSRLASVSCGSTVAARYRFGGSLGDNGDDSSGWLSLAEATHFGEPSSAQLADATSVAQRQC